ncbi:MAG: DUF4010 domain-containing protein [Bacteroidota bacterium]
MEKFLSQIPDNFYHFLIVTVFSLIIGLSQRKLHPINEDSRLFGTDRTFTFIGILGYILFIVEPVPHFFYMGGGVIISIFLGINYFFKLRYFKDFGLTTVIIAIITYCMAPLVITQPPWFYIMVVVTVLVFTELKETFSTLTQRFDKEEFLTLAKFLLIAGIILPIVPNEPFVSFLSLTPYKIWLAVVVISSISYLSYLLKKFVFIKSGIIISGILGGLYSSTATTIILAKKSRETTALKNNYAAAIVFATSMMYLRVLILILIFNMELFQLVLPYFLVMLVVSIATGIVIFYYKKKVDEVSEISLLRDKNPLEFKVALIFMLLFVGFTFLTYYTVQYFGTGGLNTLSIVVGVTDIDPFLINLFQGKYPVSLGVIAFASMQAIISNNVLKLIYGLAFSGKHIRKPLLAGFGVIIFINAALLLIMYLTM